VHVVEAAPPVVTDVRAAAAPSDVEAPARRLGWPAEAGVVALTWFVGQLVFFRAQWTSGFGRSMGDPGAARFIIYVNENWYQALLGHASWRSPAFYYPQQHNLGLSDTFLLWQVVYAPLRGLGADPFLAYQLALVASSALGFATFYALTRTLWRPPVLLGLLGAALFAFSNALYLNANHPQLFGVLLVPSVVLLGVASWRAAVATRRWRAASFGAGAAALGILVVYSTYYVGYFAILGVGLAAVLSVLVAPRATARSLRDGVRGGGWQLPVGVVLGAVLPGILFAVTYLPALHSSGGYHLDQARFFAPTLSDLLNVGSGNLVWGHAVVGHVVTGAAAQSERAYATAPLLLLAALVAAVLATVRERRAPAPPRGRRYSAAVLAATGVALSLAPMLIGSVFVWRAVYWIPGASGIRAIDRIGVVATGFFILALVDAVVRLAPWRSHGLLVRVGLAAVAVLLCVEQVNVSNSSQLSRTDQVALLAAVPSPPAGCRSFFVESATASAQHPARVQTTAMLLSERFGIPTINGTSGSFPAGWQPTNNGPGIFYPMRPGYLDAVARWVHDRGIAGTVCALNLDTNVWSTPFATSTGGP
jgi:hypothetical protein